MKKLIGILALVCISIMSNAQSIAVPVAEKVNSKLNRKVEASCGECKFGMQGTGCALAVRINGKSYLVDKPYKLDSFGDAHAQDGMCNMIRYAEVKGDIKGNKFVATSFKLLAIPAPKTN
jgi:predicted aldo/keto reductase-like oxidoreductase